MTIREAIAEAIRETLREHTAEPARALSFLGIHNSRGNRGMAVIEARNALTKQRTIIATVPSSQLEAAALEAITALQEGKKQYEPQRLSPRVDRRRTGKALARQAS